MAHNKTDTQWLSTIITISYTYLQFYLQFRPTYDQISIKNFQMPIDDLDCMARTTIRQYFNTILTNDNIIKITNIKRECQSKQAKQTGCRYICSNENGFFGGNNDTDDGVDGLNVQLDVSYMRIRPSLGGDCSYIACKYGYQCPIYQSMLHDSTQYNITNKYNYNHIKM